VGLGEAVRTLAGALAPRRKHQLALLTALTLANAVADLAMVAAAMAFLAVLAGDAGGQLPQPLGDWLFRVPAERRVFFAAVLFGGSALAANLIRLLVLRLGESFTAGVSHELTMEVHRRVFAQPYDYHVRHHSSELLGSLEAVERLAHNLVRQWLQSIAALTTGLAIAWLLISIDPLPALLAFAVLGLFYLAVARLASRRLRANSDIVGRAYGERLRKAQESLGAIRDLKIDHTERAQLEDFGQANARYARAGASTAFIAGAPRYVVEAGAIVLIAGLAVLLSSRGQASALVLVGGIALGGMRALPLLQQAYHSWAMMAANRAIAGQVVDLLSLPVPPESVGDAEPMPFRSAIRLDRLAFRYPQRETPALRDVTLTIERGSRIGLAGETGSGKSTLVDLIMGLLQPQSGAIEVDGQRLDRRHVRAWQRNIAHVSQSIFLADASIARNIAFSVPGAEPDMARVRNAATRAGIGEFIESLPDGFETRVGERGVRLSGGQRQRIGIARALFKDAPVLILDEATNALDEETEARVLASLFAEQERTILIIAHRASALGLCDRVMELKDGRIVSD
jgi:ABC-type multidrug transport system fused ATPase/permease subunit